MYWGLAVALATWYNSQEEEKKQNVLTVEEQLVTVNERIQEVENELKQLRSQRKEILEKIEEQKKETLFRAVIASGRTVEDVLAILKAQDQKKEQ